MDKVMLVLYDAGAIAGKDKKLQTHVVRINSKAL